VNKNKLISLLKLKVKENLIQFNNIKTKNDGFIYIFKNIIREFMKV